MVGLTKGYDDEFARTFTGISAVRDPRMMRQLSVDNTLLQLVWSGTVYPSSEGSFWDNWFSVQGDTIDCAATLDSYNTVVDMSGGPGFCSNLVGPVASAYGVTTWRITVDGVVYTHTNYANTSNRAMVGNFHFVNDAAHTTWNDRMPEHLSTTGPLEGNDMAINYHSAPVGIFGPGEVIGGLINGVVLGFLDSFKAEVKCSVAISSTAYHKKAGSMAVFI